MNMVEILAPVGSADALTAAVRCGADAVYLGLDGFNARQNAKNFTFDTLKEAVDYCHLYQTKVYLTLNTLVSDAETTAVAGVIEFASKCNIDAFIVQDLGILNLIKEIAPDAKLHASTQLSVQTLDGINALYALGFSRAVIPRELCKDEIKFLCDHSPIELEMFIHGALCMSISGQCYMSAMIGSRSGNRGLCAQPCRLPFKVPNGTGYDLSLKDNSLIEYMDELAEMGIKSFKIEGRMKRPEYVASAVTACRHSIDKNPLFSENYRDLKDVFSRSGFTQGYYLNTLGRAMFGIRQKEDIINAGKVLDKLSSLYEKDTAIYPVKFKITLKENQHILLDALCQNIKISVKSDFIVQKAINKPISRDIIENQLQKCGATAFYFDSLEIDSDDNIAVSLSQINQLRRLVLDTLRDKIIARTPPVIHPYKETKTAKHTSAENPIAYFCFSDVSQIPDNIDKNATIFLPLSTDIKIFERLISDGYKIGTKMPRGIFGKSDTVITKLEALKSFKIEKVIAPTLDAIALAKTCQFKIIAGIGTNIYNTKALEAFESQGIDEAVLSFEMTAHQINHLGGEIKRGIAIYGKLPLMLTRNCPMKNGTDCSACKQNGFLTDRMGNHFTIDCNNGCCEILNPFPLYVLDKTDTFKNVDFYLFEFTDESRAYCKKIIEDYHTKAKPPEKDFTRGLYFRGVQ